VLRTVRGPRARAAQRAPPSGDGQGTQPPPAAVDPTHRCRQTAHADPATQPPVSILVPAYNEAAGIEATIRSLAASRYPEFEIIVIDDGSSDSTADIARAVDVPGVTVVSQPNGGKASALNNGISRARHDLMVLIDGDTVFEPGTLPALVAAFTSPGIGAVSGNVKVGNRVGLLGRWQHLEYSMASAVERRMYDEVGAVPCIPGAVGAYRRSALLDVGGVPGETLAEDTDLTMRVQRAGWRVAFAPDARAWTEAPLTLGSLWRQRYRWIYGTLQAVWRNRGAVREHGPAGRLGRFTFPYIVVFSCIAALIAPLVDIVALVALASGDWHGLAATWGALNVITLLFAAMALRLDGESLRSLWAVPLQQFVYRQLLYLAVLASIRSAVFGDRLRWQQQHRTGLADIRQLTLTGDRT
jgi:cellulose synthase/poly-beta-1,6-N-acetylglucosamine synthase-like glycosyltransferase